MKPKHILVVDDEASFTRLLKLNLETRTGHIVTVINRAHEAIAAARKNRPDLVFLDVIMPTVDGGELAARFQADPVLRGVPMVYLTATVTRGETAKGAKNGGIPLLAKPVSLADLLACVAEHLGPHPAAEGRSQPPGSGLPAKPA